MYYEANGWSPGRRLIKAESQSHALLWVLGGLVSDTPANPRPHRMHSQTFRQCAPNPPPRHGENQRTVTSDRAQTSGREGLGCPLGQQQTRSLTETLKAHEKEKKRTEI